MTKATIESIALFMIFLIITLPFYISSVHALPSINSGSVYGENNIQGPGRDPQSARQEERRNRWPVGQRTARQ